MPAHSSHVEVGCVTVGGFVPEITSGSTTYLNDWNWPGYSPWPTYPGYPTYPTVTFIPLSVGPTKISLDEANKLREAAKADPALGRILGKLRGHIEIDAEGIFE